MSSKTFLKVYIHLAHKSRSRLLILWWPVSVVNLQKWSWSILRKICWSRNQRSWFLRYCLCFSWLHISMWVCMLLLWSLWIGRYLRLSIWIHNLCFLWLIFSSWFWRRKGKMGLSSWQGNWLIIWEPSTQHKFWLLCSTSCVFTSKKRRMFRLSLSSCKKLSEACLFKAKRKKKARSKRQLVRVWGITLSMTLFWAEYSRDLLQSCYTR